MVAVAKLSGKSQSSLAQSNALQSTKDKRTQPDTPGVKAKPMVVPSRQTAITRVIIALRGPRKILKYQLATISQYS